MTYILMLAASSAPSAGDHSSGGMGPLNLVLLILAALVLLAVIPSMIAQEKGRQMGKWYIYSYLLFPLALVHSIILKKKDATEKCPKCKKEISVLAIECTHCSYQLAGDFRVGSVSH